ncbi:MAG: peptidase S41, partial [Synechococcus sp.]
MAALLLALLWLLPTAAPALALNDAQQLVVEAWRLVNQSYVDPERFEAVHWRCLRQKALEQPITSSADAYAAIEAMLAPIGDPYTRLLRPADYGALQSATQQGTVSGVGLQLGLRGADEQVVVIAPLDGSPAADAQIPSGSEVVSVNGEASRDLGLDLTAARLRGPAGSTVLVQLRQPGGELLEVELERRHVDLRPVRSKRLRHDGHTLGYLRITQFSEPVP